MKLPTALLLATAAVVAAPAAGQAPTVLASWNFDGSVANQPSRGRPTGGVLGSTGNAFASADVATYFSCTTCVGSGGTGFVFDVYNFGTQGALASNATRGAKFCLFSTVDWIPTSITFEKKQLATSPRWEVAFFSVSNASLTTAFLPLVGVVNTAVMSQSASFEPRVYDLGPTVAAYPQIANSPAGFCVSIRAMFDPGTSVFTQTSGSSLYSTSSGDWQFDNVAIWGQPFASPSPSNQPTASISTGASPSVSTSLTASPSATATPTGSPACPPVVVAPTALSGVVTTTIPGTSNTAEVLYSYAGSCAAGYAVLARPKRFIRVQLPAGTPLGGFLNASTVLTGTVTPDTVMHVGTGCGYSLGQYACLVGNDQGGTGYGNAARVQLGWNASSASSSGGVFYLAVSMFSSTAADTPVTVDWNYVMPTPSPSGTGTPSSSVTPTASSTISSGASPSTTTTSSLTPSTTPSSSRTSTGTPTVSTSVSATPTPTGSPACPPAMVVPSTGEYSGFITTTIPGTATASEPLYSYGGACGGYALTSTPKRFIQLELPAGTPAGGWLNISTAPSGSLDTVLHIGSSAASCGHSAAAFGCSAGNDQRYGNAAGLFVGWNDTTAASVFAGGRVYVAVARWSSSSTDTAVTLDWTYVLPTPSQTPSGTPSASTTQTAAATGTATPSTTLSPGATASVTSSRTPSPTGTPSNSPSGSVTASQTPSRTPTPTPSPSTPCPPAALAEGLTGGLQLSIPGSSVPSVPTFSGPCAGFNLNVQPKALVRLQLPPGTPLGGTLDASTCLSGTTLDLVLHVGTGCGTSASGFACQAGNDESCGSGARVVLPGVSQATLFIAVARYSSLSANTSFTLDWTYTPPSPSPSGSPAASGTASGTAPASASAPVTASGTATPTPSAAATGTGTPAVSASDTGTAAVTPSWTGTAAATGSGTRSPTPSVSASGTGSRSATGSSSETGSVSASGTGTAAATGSPTGSRIRSGTASGTKSRAPSGSRTRTRSGSRTRTATRTRTKSKTRTRSRTRSASRKKKLQQ